MSRGAVRRTMKSDVPVRILALIMVAFLVGYLC